MADFLSGIFDRAGDLIDGISGKSNRDLLNKEIANQQATNAQIVELEKQRLAIQQTPEYIAAKQKKVYVAAVIVIVCVVLGFVLFRNKT